MKLFSDDPQSTKAWARGAQGEARLARYLLRTLGPQTVTLHDRRVPGSKANIDHIIVAASGIWIVDAKNYKGKVEQRDIGGWLHTEMRLYVNGRDQSKLVDGLAKQVNAVLEAIEDADIEVTAALCFVNSEWGLFAKPFRLGGTLVTWPQKLSAVIAGPGPLSPGEVGRIGEKLVSALPPAVST
jgi:hypothetical protein